MNKIYLPESYVNYSCKVINNGYIRVYTNSNNTQWADVYINQDYQVKLGSSNYVNTVTCDNLHEYTSNIWYRTDIDKIMIVFISIFIIVWTLCTLVWKSLFKGPRRL